MKNVSHHAKQRINERGNETVNTYNKSLAKNAKKNGINVSEYCKKFKNTPLIDYIFGKIRKYPKTATYFYLNYIFIFSSTKNLLITMYPIPHRFRNEVQMNLNRDKYHMSQRTEILSISKKTGNYQLYVKYYSKMKRLGNFKDEKTAYKYGVEYFFMSPLGIKYFEDNKNGNYTSFLKFLIEKQVIEVRKKEQVIIPQIEENLVLAS